MITIDATSLRQLSSYRNMNSVNPDYSYSAVIASLPFPLAGVVPFHENPRKAGQSHSFGQRLLCPLRQTQDETYARPVK